MFEGDVLFEKGMENTGYVYFVNHGLVSIRIKNNNSLKNAVMGEIIGLEYVFDNSPHKSTARVEANSEIYSVPLNYFKSLAENHLFLEILCKKE